MITEDQLEQLCLEGFDFIATLENPLVPVC